MELTGELFIASERVRRDEGAFRAVDPAAGFEIEPAFSAATSEDVAAACAAADQAAPSYANLGREQRAHFLEAIATEIDDLGDALIERAAQESGLPLVRLTGERSRTTNQLRLFAREVRLGDFLRVRIDHALPDRAPPRPDLRMHMVPLGTVAVFGASNFPLAFSVAGGDTAAAFAAGCPVVVKGHPAHPGTSEMVAGAILRAMRSTSMPDGLFSLVNGTSHSVGAALVSDPRIKAVGFTGSRRGGLALLALAQARPVPVPVYAEMSSINPVFLLPAALETRPEALGSAYVDSVTLGAGQFCTNPGLVVGVEGEGLRRFIDAASKAMGGAAAQTMLTTAIHRSFAEAVERWSSSGLVTRAASGAEPAGPTCSAAALFTISGREFLANRDLAEEVFGASSLIVRCADAQEMIEVAGALEGQLTATLQLDDADTDLARFLLPKLEQLAGRILANGWPTGVEVCDAQVHGGPFPATSDGRSTSVGTLAIERFLRPIAYQNLPQALLSPDLYDAADVPARIDGVHTLRA